MVKWVNAQQYGSPIAEAITSAATALYGDTLTPALKKAQLEKLQRENAGTTNLVDFWRSVGNAAGSVPRGTAAPVRGTGGRSGGPVFTGTQNPGGLPQSVINAVDRVDPGGTPMARGIASTAAAMGMPPVDLGTIISYETGGTFDPMQIGPTTQHGQHQGLIQFGEPQAAQYGADFGSPEAAMASQFGPDGAIVRYFEDNGWQPGMGMLDAYSIVNAGGPGRYGASDAMNGGAPGTVADKVNGQMSGHAANAAAMFGEGAFLPEATPSPMTGAPATGGEYNPMNPGQFFGELAARTAESGGDAGDAAALARMFMAGSYGAESQAATDAFVGAGGDYGNSYSGFAADQNRQERGSLRGDRTAQRGQDLTYQATILNNILDNQTATRGQDMTAATSRANDGDQTVEVLRNGQPLMILKRDMLPTDQPILSADENKAQVAGGLDMSRDEQLAYVGADPGATRKATWMRTPDGTTVPTIDGVTNARSGEVLPDGTLPVSATGSLSDMGLDKINARDLESQVLAGNQFKGTIGRARETAKAAGPSAFGVVGQARSIGQDAKAAVDAVSGIFGGQIEQSVQATEAQLQSMAEQGDPVASQFFTAYDPNLTQIQMYARLLPYEAAMAIAGQEGRGLSDSDVKRFQAIVGDPLSFWGSQQAFLVTLDTIEREVDARLANSRAVLEGGRDAAMPPAAPIAPKRTATGVTWSVD